MRQVVLRAFAVFALGLYGACWPAPALRAQDWPSKPIHIIVPFPPGGTTDQIARHVQPRLEQDLKATIIIENRGGASGSIGTQAAAFSPPDGTTFLMVFDTHAVNPSLQPNLPFDTLKDLAPINADRQVADGHYRAPDRILQKLRGCGRRIEKNAGLGRLWDDRRGKPCASCDEPDRE
jgi:tripartite-type tricarboxylate transporter receptor subunit TctC